MHINTIRDRLKRTIAGKQMLLDTYCNPEFRAYPEPVRQTMIQFLETNITELASILQDVESCCDQSSHDSWITNPDRMGGAFTTEERDSYSSWK
jgi:hypothetical protein